MGDIIQFPKVVQIAQVFNSGLFGLVVDNVKRVTIYETSVMIWFSDKPEDSTWDMSLEYESVEEAQASYEDLLDTLRQLRFKVLKPDNEVDK